MKFPIPHDLLNTSFECDKCGFISNMFTYENDCSECGYFEDDSEQCWKTHITRDLQFQCNCENANKLEGIYKCPKCNSTNIEILPDDDTYEITCNDCNHVEIITEEQIKQMLQEQYTFLDKTELSKKLDDDIFNDTMKMCHPNIGRNDPCPCGSGKKFKHCHGK